jgi:hypothetical protein
MTPQEKTQFHKYWKAIFKPLFIIFALGVTLRIVMMINSARDEDMSLMSIFLGYTISTLGALGLALLVAWMGIQKERE